MSIGEIIKQAIKDQGITKVALAEGIGITRGTLDNWIKGNSSPTHEDLIKMSKFLNVNISQLTLRATKGQRGTDNNIPFYDTIATAGMTAYQADQSPVIQPSETVNPGTWFRSATAAMRVYGDSMYPKYKSGCIIALKEIHDKDEVIYGEDYVVETSEQRVLKRVMKSEKGEEHIEMNSINPQQDARGRQIYAPKDFHLSKVRRIYKVLGQILYEAGGDSIVHKAG